ncbi:MAG TPA: hypothetical protein PLS28_02185, partial [Clostridiales bacterium]|nr:hypothetical protein [Clostridiales bacterium]
VIENGEAKLNQNGLLPVDGNQYYLVNGKVQEESGLTKIGDLYYYLQNGKLEDYTGLVTDDIGTWLVQNGKVDFSYTGVFEAGEKAYNVVASKVVSEANI